MKRYLNIYIPEQGTRLAVTYDHPTLDSAMAGKRTEDGRPLSEVLTVEIEEKTVRTVRVVHP